MSIAAAGRNDICVFCQFTRPFKRARASSIASRTSIAPFATSMRVRDTQRSSAPSSASLQKQIQLYSPVDIFRSTFLAKKHRDLPAAAPRRKIFQKEKFISEKRFGDNHAVPDEVTLDQLTVEVLQMQLEACESSKDFIRVVSVAFQSAEGTRLMASSSMQNLFARNIANRKIRSQDRLIAFNRMISYLRASNIPVTLELAFGALEQAAFSNSLVAFKDILTHLWNRQRKRGELRRFIRSTRSFPLFRVLVGLGKGHKMVTKYGKRTENAIQEILYGDPGVVKHNRICLRSFLPSSHKHITRAWMALLETCRMFAAIEEEWESELGQNENSPLHCIELLLGVIRARFLNGNIAGAWDLLSEYDHRQGNLSAEAVASDKRNIGQFFLDHLESMPQDLSARTMAHIESQCTHTLKWHLEEMETELGITWVTSKSGDRQESYHLLHDIEKLVWRRPRDRR